MLQPRDKTALTRAKNRLQKWNTKFMEMDNSPFITEQYRRALINYNEVVNRLKQKYRGVNLQLEI